MSAASGGDGGAAAALPATERQAGLTFSDFLSKMKDPAAADLVRNIKSFIRHFEERAAGVAVDPEADSAKVQAFLAQSEALFRQHPVWRGCQPEVLDQAVEGLEKYVMSKVWRQTFGAWPEDRERDERYQRLMQALGFVELHTLMGADVKPDETLLGLAQAEVLKMDRYKAPRDKLLCLVNVKTMVENIVQLAATGGANIGGADAFFPVFLLVLIRSRLPRLASNIEYVKRFRMRSRLSGQFDYMLCNLESGAMYLDTVNYEHLGVSQAQFLAHLAAAGIPEAQMELERMQAEVQAEVQQPEVAERGREAATMTPGAPGAGPGSTASSARSQQFASQVATAAGPSGVARAAAEGSAAALARQEQQAAGVDDAADVLAGLQLADGIPDEQAGLDGEGPGLGSTQTSVPPTPTDAASAMLSRARGSLSGDGGRMEGSADLRSTQLSPVQLPTSASVGRAGPNAAAATAAAGSGIIAQQQPERSQQQKQEPAGLLPRGLTFDSSAELASAAEQQEQQRVQQAQQAAAVAAAASAAAQQYAEAVLIEEMVAEGTRYVLAAEAEGQLQQRYPFMYAQAEDLSLAEVQAVLVGYKELLLRYEALSRALQQQLGLGGGSSSAGGAGSPLAAAAAAEEVALLEGGRRGSSHRTKGEQQRHGFGSLIPPGQLEQLEAALGAGGILQSAPVAVAAPSAAPTGSPTAAAAVAAGIPESTSPSGCWSPGGLLQRITSRGRLSRSQTPPKERGGDIGGACAVAVAADDAVQLQSPGKQAAHPIFGTLFKSGGSSPKLGGRRRSSEAPAHAAAPQQPGHQMQGQPPVGGLPAGSSEGAATGAAARETESAGIQHLPAAGGSSHSGPELSFAEHALPYGSTSAGDEGTHAAGCDVAAVPESAVPEGAGEAAAAAPAAQLPAAETVSAADSLLDSVLGMSSGQPAPGQGSDAAAAAPLLSPPLPLEHEQQLQGMGPADAADSLIQAVGPESAGAGKGPGVTSGAAAAGAAGAGDGVPADLIQLSTSQSEGQGASAEGGAAVEALAAVEEASAAGTGLSQRDAAEGGAAAGTGAMPSLL